MSKESDDRNDLTSNCSITHFSTIILDTIQRKHHHASNDRKNKIEVLINNINITCL